MFTYAHTFLLIHTRKCFFPQEGITEFSRSDAEDIFDQNLPGSDGAPAKLHAPCVLALLAVVGSEGLSSDEREFVQNRGTGYSSAYGGTGGGFWRNASIPQARPWCHYVMAELSVADLLPIDFAEVLGSKGWLLCMLTVCYFCVIFVVWARGDFSVGCW